LFLTMVVIGLVGLVMMALPALGGHARWARCTDMDTTWASGTTVRTRATHIAGAGHGAATSPDTSPDTSIDRDARVASKLCSPTATHGRTGFIRPPAGVQPARALRAFGNRWGHAAQSRPLAALIRSDPRCGGAILFDRSGICLSAFQAVASSSLEQLILAEAHAVVPFRNGGLVTTIRDGRRVR